MPRVIAQTEGAPEKTALESNRISSVENVRNGLLVGEFDARLWDNPYNGLYLSRDLGFSWDQAGLAGRGITDIAQSTKRLYVATYYTIDGLQGLFYSDDLGKTFHHAGLDFASSAVASSGDIVLLGGYSHGLWVSLDKGTTWEQKIGDGTGWTGPAITNLQIGGEFAFASSASKVYKSVDGGVTWQEIPELAGAQVGTIYIDSNVALIGTSNFQGLYLSENQGETWTSLNDWEGYSVEAISEFKGRYFAQRITPGPNATYKLHSAVEADITGFWQDTGAAFPAQMSDQALIFSYPAYNFYAVNFHGVYKSKKEQNQIKYSQFLETPWEISGQESLLDRVTAYFDHEYPLPTEPPETETTTLNFMGRKESTPLLFYSGHRGTDFALAYGTPILAAAPGWASYEFCEACGNVIRIDHTNGYETIHLHLQSEGLVTTTGPVWVEPGDTIGKVGLTGNTSGPHLHFEVKKGAYGEVVDPFGWQDPYNSDPWELYSGVSSEYLWLTNNSSVTKYLTPSDPEVTFNNTTFKVSLETLENNSLTALAYQFIKPNIPASQAELEYIPGTSFSFNMIDQKEGEIYVLEDAMSIEVDLTELDFSKVVKDSIKLYVWDELASIWKPLPTVLDLAADKLFSETTHLSHFAILGTGSTTDTEWQPGVSVSNSIFSTNN